MSQSSGPWTGVYFHPFGTLVGLLVFTLTHLVVFWIVLCGFRNRPTQYQSRNTMFSELWPRKYETYEHGHEYHVNQEEDAI